MAFYDSIKLEKGMYNSGRSLTKFLRSLIRRKIIRELPLMVLTLSSVSSKDMISRLAAHIQTAFRSSLKLQIQLLFFLSMFQELLQ